MEPDPTTHVPLPAAPDVDDALAEAVALGEVSASWGGAVRRLEKKYAYAPAAPRTTSAATATTGMSSLRGLVHILCDTPGCLLGEGLESACSRGVSPVA